MVDFLKKKAIVEFNLEPIEKQAIPYACHFDSKTLLTKNGELFQVIKLEGYSKELMNSSDTKIDLRKIIRESIMENITDRRVALWFHTIRRKRNLDSINYFSSTFAKDTHESWAKKNYWRDKFVNELYITILYEGTEHNNPALSFTPKLLKQYFSNKLDETIQKLDTIVENMLGVLKVYGAKRLEVQHDSYGAHSEILEFLSKIICLQSKRVALPVQNLDNVFSRTKITFGGNTLEVLDEHKKHYAAIFSIKEYHEFAAKALDRFMGTSTEYIMSQTLTFIDSKEAKKSFEYYDYILGVSKDSDLKSSCGLEEIMNSDRGHQTDYGSQQMNFMIIDDSLEKLKNSVSSAIKELNKLGIVMIREDLNIELCFWSQLPGNFKFFRRSSYINTSHSASFASLNNNPSGHIENIWGSAVTLFRRADGGPHFFNFHIDNVGHTIISGPKESSKKTLLNFLLSESTKYAPDILYIDQNMSSRVTVKALEGRHEVLSLEQENPSFSFNPFSLSDSPKNYQFLKDWFLFLIFDNEYNDDQKKLVYSAVEVFLEKVPLKNRQLSLLAESFEDQNVKDRLKLWCRPNKLGRLFDNSHDEFDNGTKIIGFNVDFIARNNFHAAQALILYAMYKFSTINAHEIPCPPTIIAIDDASLLLQGQHIGNMLPNWLNDLTINNAMAIFVCDIGNEINQNIINLNDQISTHLLFPTFDYKLYKKPFFVSSQEIDLLKTMKTLHRNFMIKHKTFNMIVELNLDGLDFAIAALNGEQFAIDAMEKAIKEYGENPNVWIVPFYQYLFPNTKE